LPEKSTGFGITLDVGQTLKSDVWYPQLIKQEVGEFHISRGETGTGDVCVPENLEFTENLINEKEKVIGTVVADGGFEIGKIGKEHMENYQEIFSSRIVLSELLMCMKVLNHGGHFVCKLFDAFTAFTHSIIFVVSQVFTRCHIVKPKRSRLVNSERYLVGESLRKASTEDKERFDFFLTLLTDVHRMWKDGYVCRTLVPKAIIESDLMFMEDLSKMLFTLSTRQTEGLELVMHLAQSKLDTDSYFVISCASDGFSRDERRDDRLHSSKDPTNPRKQSGKKKRKKRPKKK